LVRSHTDPRETIDEELSLTATRAQAVIDYLIGKGLPAERFEEDGVGAAEPLFPNATDRNRRQNNRIEFQFLD
jgi:OOP family OmpA-OmpF porin